MSLFTYLGCANQIKETYELRGGLGFPKGLIAMTEQLMRKTLIKMVKGVLLERIWPPCDAPIGWLSQIGGFPNLPPEMDWPTTKLSDGNTIPLDFLAQIRLVDLPDVPDRDLLPEHGILYFFALALTNEPLEETQWRVLYSEADGSDFAAVAPPVGAGHGLGDLGYAKGPAETLHDPDDPPSLLFPRCPVRPVAASFWEEPIDDGSDAIQEWRRLIRQWQGSRPLETDFSYTLDELPRRVEDALLSINIARNRWAEGFHPIRDFILEEFSYKISRNHEVSSVVKAMSTAYEIWISRIKTEVNALKKRERFALLDQNVRARVRALVEESLNIERMIGKAYPLSEIERRSLATTALATILLDPQALSEVSDQEIAAAHPGNWEPEFESHRMLGVPRSVQSHLDQGAVLLLQLDSDKHGPRFQWWDMGNITFTIGREALKARDFGSVKAEIEGH